MYVRKRNYHLQIAFVKVPDYVDFPFGSTFKFDIYVPGEVSFILWIFWYPDNDTWHCQNRKATRSYSTEDAGFTSCFDELFAFFSLSLASIFFKALR